MGAYKKTGRLLHKACACLCLSLTGSTMFIASVSFATDRSALSVGIQTLPMLTHKITGTAKLAIIFDPANQTSKEEAFNLKTVLEDGFKAPDGLKLTNVLIPINDLTDLQGSRIAILTNGLDGHYNSISKAAATNGVLTISANLECVRIHQCILGIISKPQVEIYYSQTAADAAHISFRRVFTLTVKQL